LYTTNETTVVAVALAEPEIVKEPEPTRTDRMATNVLSFVLSVGITIDDAVTYEFVTVTPAFPAAIATMPEGLFIVAEPGVAEVSDVPKHVFDSW